ncbi:hypothetical protein [Bradyrhizobium sp.]|jgi:hypothetical protein|uniref:hypothetical protein n=1 Tax=Bradyrhizobium sp. TaxID=376 RepID=UPI002C0B0161|nr:hypothetical protein [Bradyrhizobium sp.]HWX62348.1 hypothetical protein [Bradyrhizobium sp.]
MDHDFLYNLADTGKGGLAAFLAGLRQGPFEGSDLGAIGVRRVWMKFDPIEPNGRALLLEAVLLGFQGSDLSTDRTGGNGAAGDGIDEA